jgi:hypothetical protein
MTWLWIDDCRPAPYGMLWVKSSEEALAFLKKVGLERIDTISFDHDLGGTDTTIPVINWIEEEVSTKGLPVPNMIVHSMNPVGRRNLQRAIERIRAVSANVHRADD